VPATAVGRNDGVFLIAPGDARRYVDRWIVAGRTVAGWSITIGVGDQGGCCCCCAT
jgi:hypothetical protein